MKKFLYKVAITYTITKYSPMLNGKFKEPKNEIHTLVKNLIFDRLIQSGDSIYDTDFMETVSNILHVQYKSIEKVELMQLQELKCSVKETITQDLYSYLKLFCKGVNLLYEVNPSKSKLHKFYVDASTHNKKELYQYIFAIINEQKCNELKRIEFLKIFYNDVVSILESDSIAKYDELNLNCSFLEPHNDILLKDLDKNMLIAKIEHFLVNMVTHLTYSILQILSSNCDFLKGFEHKSLKVYLDEYSKNLLLKERMIKLEKGISINDHLVVDEQKSDINIEVDNQYQKEHLKGLFKFNPKNNDYLYDCLQKLDSEFSLSDTKKCYQNTFCAIALLIYNRGCIVKGVTYIFFLEALCRYFNRPIPKETKPNKYAKKSQELQEKYYILDNLPLK